ncbi:Ig-like domain repeat protein [Nocardioides sp. YIM 152588]|uniref:substrate-binding domain-containing protein n=1 Tax=Nocardioides sp. YIM 152588 TaxID=3158259 RepID=UPI0032E4DD11
MSARKTFGGIVAGTLATAAVFAGAAPSYAVYTADPDDVLPTGSSDLIGAGSDTTQHAMKLIADGWNASLPAPEFGIASIAATTGGGATPGDGSSTVPFLGGEISRPNGSTAGKSLLYGANENAEIDFARSSSGLKDAEKDAGLQLLPFAVDALKMAVSNEVASHAPASLTIDDLVKIYDGTYTNWSQVGGTAGTIVPMLPQDGSGTLSFFTDQLKAANGGTAVTLAPSVVRVQEHDDTEIKGNANAIAPFSVGRAGLLDDTVDLLDGFSAQRALYNVVRADDLEDADIQTVFGPEGFVCSDQGGLLIAEAGFQQLASEADGGECGVATQASTSNFATSGAKSPIATSVALKGTSKAARKAVLSAVVSGSTKPDGTVTFLEGDDVVAEDVPLIGGTATASLTGLAPGKHTYTAVYAPVVGSLFQASEDDGKVTVKTTAAISETFPAKVAKGKKAKGVVAVALKGVAAKATGKVTVLKGAKKVGTAKLVKGKATLTLAKLAKGKNKLTITWGGNAAGVAAKKKFTITQR